jgi:hypothetical protein
MKVCGIVGSPNKNGNVDLLVSQVVKGARSQGAEIRKLYLNDMTIQHYQDLIVALPPLPTTTSLRMTWLWSIRPWSHGI